MEAAFDAGDIDLHAKITLRPTAGLVAGRPPGRRRASRRDDESTLTVETTAGRVFFNEALPEGFRYVNDVVGKRNTPIGSIVEELAAAYEKHVVAASLDRIKALGFRFAAQSGLTISIDDVRTPPDKQGILDRYEKEAEKAENQFKRGIITDDERRQKEIEIWTSANSEVGRAMEQTLSTLSFNPLDMMVDSGARGNAQQIRQIAGMKGLVSNPRGEMIPRPIKSSFREGLIGARVLHLHPRRPQGPGRHRPADGRLGLPDPPAGRRGPGADRARGGLRDHPGHLDRRGRARRAPGGAATSRPAPTAGSWSSRWPCRTGPRSRPEPC